MEAKLFMVAVDKNPAEAAKIAKEVAGKIESKEVKLLDVVQSLGEYLTDEDRTIRAKSISYLSSVLAHIDPKLLSRQQITVLVEFLCERLDDEVAVKEITNGIIALQGMLRFSRDDAQRVSKTVLNKVDMRKHPQGTRFVVFTLIDRLMSKNRAALKDQGATFVREFTDFVEGEKDPRNLMIVFSLWRVILVEFEILEHVEDIFDAIYCYFPITFRPPPDDPYGITAQDLKNRLRDCLSSTHYFGRKVFPALIEKLDSAVLNVKRDSLQTITACIQSYGPNSIKRYFQKIWDAVKYEVTNALPSEGDDIVEDALNVLKALAACLSTAIDTVSATEAPLAKYIKAVVGEVSDSLKEPQGKKAKASAAILAAVASAGPLPHAGIMTSVLPPLMTIYQDAEEVTKRKAWMEITLQLLKSSLKVYGERGDENAPPTLENPIIKFRDRLFEIYSQSLMGGWDETSLRITAIEALNVMSKTRDFIPDSDVRVIALHLNEVLLQEEKDELRSLAIRGLLDISKFNSNLTIETTFPALMAALPDTDAKSSEDPDTLVLQTATTARPYPMILESLALLSLDDAHFSVLSTRLLNKINVLNANNASAEYVQQVIGTIYSVLEKKQLEGHASLSKHLERIVFSLLAKTLYPLVFPTAKSTVMGTDGVLGMTARLANFMIRQASAEEQESLFAQFWKIFVSGEETDLRGFDNDAMTLMRLSEKGETVSDARKKLAEVLRPFDSTKQSTDIGRDSSLVIFACAFAGLRREVALPAQPFSIAEFLQKNIELARSSTVSLARQSHHLIIALIINKYLKGVDQEGTLKQEIESIIASVKDVNSNTRESDLRILFWIAKALVLKGDKYATNRLLGELIGLLSLESIGSLAAKGFSIILKDDDLLDAQNFAVENKLSKQRVFSIAVPQIVQGFRSATSDFKPNLLVALSNILRNVPSEYILPELGDLFPLLLQSLDLHSDPEVKNATINTIYVTVLESSDAAKEHISSLINRLLATSSDQKLNPPRVRAAALRCLRAFQGSMKSEILQPHKSNVIRGLVPALDDPKRSVRREAVDCRARWFIVDEPEDDD